MRVDSPSSMRLSIGHDSFAPGAFVTAGLDREALPFLRPGLFNGGGRSGRLRFPAGAGPRFRACDCIELPQTERSVDSPARELDTRASQTERSVYFIHGPTITRGITETPACGIPSTAV